MFSRLLFQFSAEQSISVGQALPYEFIRIEEEVEIAGCDFASVAGLIHWRFDFSPIYL
jgi:hypothetical protein